MMQCRIAFITGCGLWRAENRWGFWHSGRSRCKFCAFGNQEVVETLTQGKECLISFPSTFLGKWRPQKWEQKRPEALNLSLSVRVMPAVLCVVGVLCHVLCKPPMPASAAGSIFVKYRKKYSRPVTHVKSIHESILLRWKTTKSDLCTPLDAWQ